MCDYCWPSMEGVVYSTSANPTRESLLRGLASIADARERDDLLIEGPQSDTPEPSL